MDKNSVITFFDDRASAWDETNIQNPCVINKIIDIAGVKKGVSLLDVACGTGVLFEEYIARGITQFTAIDISPEMVKQARKKYSGVMVYCGDAELYSFKEKFDCILIFNAYPHFVSPENLLRNLCSHLNKGGRLTIAHGASRKAILECHAGVANSISNELPPIEALEVLVGRYLAVDNVVSDDEMYLISGVKL